MLRHLPLAAALALAPVAAAAQTYSSSAGPLAVETVARGLNHPWALAFLPDGRMLVTERPGRLRIVTAKGEVSKPVENVPKVFARGQGGLLDIILDRNFTQNRTLYFSYAEPVSGGGRTALARAVLDAGAAPALRDVKVIFQQSGPPSSSNHFGGRIVQGADGNLFITTGDHFTDRDMAQTLDNDLGKVVRITPTGEVPKDNPFVNRADARAIIWSYGHRNPQGLAINPADGSLWEQEHGARGGDEINIIKPGRNYGWPVVSFGVNYDGTPVGTGKQQAEGMEDSVWHWTPSIAPSGLTFYTGTLFPQWKGSLFSGALRSQFLSRLDIKDGKPVKEERLLQNLNERIRDVRQGPDGALYLLTDADDGRILRVAPAK
ncbi:PQQ-dependent sugar dehydrogenase [Undibacter mobilis]|uniref:PQQ-dependent sugar dehydrogenase n=1 Tax=Undibacter mobilis TaxID=2292256 RepID=A0A371BDF0_9BRAD|nr:PQQ-dependent sugar dehydrogenase [Undibacter mobilis]RDV05636.1 PQQ-dependent sugar dehydrogenase [Undibacter mobilis]